VKRYRPQILLLFGAALVMVSIVWELARMNPNTAYLVEPWSMRGYESVHGSVTFTIGALLFLAGLLTIWQRSREPLVSRLIAVLIGLGAIGVAVIYGGPDKTFGGGFLGWVFAGLSGYIARSAAAPLLAKLNSATRTMASLGVFGATTLLLYFAVFSREIEAPPVVWVAVATALLVGLAVTGSPAALAANRTLIFAVTGGGAAIALSAAAARTNLIEKQLALDGITGQYKDTQITSGYFIALGGILLAFVGAVSLWAKRRDIIINQQRAERQRRAAEASAAEIQAALELAQEHQREARARQQG
jgi:hypothetical protein